MEDKKELFCPECKKVTEHRILPNDRMSFRGRVWELRCWDCGTFYSVQTEWGRLTEETVKKLLDTREQCKMFWTQEEREAAEMLGRRQS